MKAGGIYLPADMICQFRVRTCADRTRATGDRVRRSLFARAIDAGARDLPHVCDARQTIIASKGRREGQAQRLDLLASKGRRECPAHRLDLLWAKGRLPSIAAILA